MGLVAFCTHALTHTQRHIYNRYKVPTTHHLYFMLRRYVHESTSQVSILKWRHAFKSTVMNGFCVCENDHQ